jgi:RNA 2',3'-cyclic 3'-phosphodiesterase
MRLFIGIPLALQVVDEVSAVCRRLQTDRDGLRWTSPESWHITLQFLGETSSERYECVVARLREVQCPRVRVQLEGLGFFDRVGVFFADVEVNPELAALQRLVMNATARCGFVAELRPYHPHVTLARAKGGRGEGLRALRERIRRGPQFTGFAAEEFSLYEALLSPSGSRYEVSYRFAFVDPSE